MCKSADTRTLSAEQWGWLQRNLRFAPDRFGLVGHLWDGKLLSEHLRRHYGVALGVRQCQHLELLFLPPYSPQLAPIERVWKLARRLATHNRYSGSLEALTAAVQGCFNQWGEPNPVLRRLCGVI